MSYAEEGAQQLALRPAKPGARGKPVVVVSNHFAVNLTPGRVLYHYRVDIDPAVGLRALNRVVVEKFVEDNFPGKLFAYDGMFDGFTAHALDLGPDGVMCVDVVLPPAPGRREGRPFTVTLKLVDTLPLDLLEEYRRGNAEGYPALQIQALEIGLQQMALKNFTPGTRSKYYSDTLFPKVDIGRGLELWKGFYQSVRLVQTGVTLNFDITNTAFFKPMKVIDFLRTMDSSLVPDGGAEMPRPAIHKAKKLLLKMVVSLDHLTKKPQKKRCMGLTPKSANEETFERAIRPTSGDTSGLWEREETTIAAYYKDVHGINLAFPNLPCLALGKIVRVPMELCSIVPGQRFVGKLSGDQTAKVIKAVIQRPDARMNDTLRLMKAAHATKPDEYCKDFGIKISQTPVECPARTLPTPVLYYGGTDKAKAEMKLPFPGSWDLRGKTVHSGATVYAMAAITFCTTITAPELTAFVKMQVDGCKKLGLKVNPKILQSVPIVRGNLANVKESLQNAYSQCKSFLSGPAQMPIIICVLPDKNNITPKADVKRIAETELMVSTQCILAGNVKKYAAKDARGALQFFCNVGMKINCKLGGRNVALNFRTMLQPFLATEPTCLFGADVTHPHAGSHFPSIASVVASMDWPFLTKFGALCSAQTSRQETIQDLWDPEKKVGMVKTLLVGFYRSCKQKPKRIVMFRDGVSEGQFGPVLAEELKAFRLACEDLEEGYAPNITYIVVTKRHNTKFAPKKSAEGDRSGNIVAGTVIDAGVCDNKLFDFYLCSHAGLQGSSKPAHYHVLHDENGFTCDGLQELCFALTHTYQRCTRSVSLVPPTYYAHLAAFRARAHLGMDADSSSDSESVASSGPTSSLPAMGGFFAPAAPGAMYYM